MEVYALVSGLSSSGNRYDTNTAVLHVDVLPEIFVPDDNEEVAASSETGDTGLAGSSSESSSGDTGSGGAGL
jgi:hypothetical protein